MKKITFVVHKFDFETRGGVLKVVSLLSNEFVRKHKVEILSLGPINKYPYFVDDRIEVVSLNIEKYDTRFYSGMLKIFWFIVSLYKIISNIDGSKVYMTTSPPLNLLFSILKIFKRKVKVIACDHTSAVYKSKGSFGFIRNILYKNLDKIIALTEDDNLIYKKNKINSVYIPNPIEKVYGITESKRNRLIYVGRYSKEKRPELALESYYKSKLWESGILFYMYGFGEMESELINFIRKYSIEKYVKLINSESDPNIIYKDVYALLLTSKVEGFGMVLLEALSRGIPCVAFNAPYGPKNIIKDNVNGFLVNHEADIYKFLAFDKIKVLNEKSIIASIGVFNLENVSLMWESLFNEIF